MSSPNKSGHGASIGVVGLVLAGGESRRFPGGAKALQTFGGQPMVSRVMARLAPQVDALALAVGAGHDGLEELHAHCLYDAVPSYRGPLAGLQAGLQRLAAGPGLGLAAGTGSGSDSGAGSGAGSGSDSGPGSKSSPRSGSEAAAWLQLAPCDAPFLPLDLVRRLQAAVTDQAQVVVPRVDGHLQPTFAAWHGDSFRAVDEALAEPGGLGLLDVLRRLAFEVVDWPAGETPPPFFNVNDAEDLDRATAWLHNSE